MPKHNKQHLHNRFNRLGIDEIYNRIANEENKFALCEEYDISVESIDRILNRDRWTPTQRRVWGYDSCPKLPKNCSYRPGSIGVNEYKAAKPCPKQKKKDTSDFHKTTEYESDATAANRYSKENRVIAGKPSLQATLEEDYKPQESNRLPSFKAKMDNIKLNHHLEAIDVCFELLQEEVALLKLFLKKE
jgi:hypothetical protein